MTVFWNIGFKARAQGKSKRKGDCTAGPQCCLPVLPRKWLLLRGDLHQCHRRFIYQACDPGILSRGMVAPLLGMLTPDNLSAGLHCS